jgi:hypothetical protein
MAAWSATRDFAHWTPHSELYPTSAEAPSAIQKFVAARMDVLLKPLRKLWESATVDAAFQLRYLAANEKMHMKRRHKVVCILRHYKALMDDDHSPDAGALNWLENDLCIWFVGYADDEGRGPFPNTVTDIDARLRRVTTFLEQGISSGDLDSFVRFCKWQRTGLPQSRYAPTPPSASEDAKTRRRPQPRPIFWAISPVLPNKPNACSSMVLAELVEFMTVRLEGAAAVSGIPY